MSSRQRWVWIVLFAIALSIAWFAFSSDRARVDDERAATPTSSPSFGASRVVSTNESSRRVLAPIELEPTDAAPKKAIASERIEARSSEPSARTKAHGSIWGHVIDQDKKPVGRVPVLLIRWEGDVGLFIDTKDDGSFDCGELRSGEYALDIGEPPPGYLAPFDERRYVALDPDLLAPRHFGTSILLDLKRPEVEVDLTVFQSASLRGRVVDIPDSAAKNLRVRLQSVEHGLALLHYETPVEPSGWYEFAPVYPGSYQLEVLLDLHDDLDRVACPIPQSITLHGGEHRTMWDLEFATGTATIFGHVFDELGRPLSAARVLCAVDRRTSSDLRISTLENLLELTTSKEDGYFAFQGLEPGSVKLVAVTGLDPNSDDVAVCDQASPVLCFQAIGDSNFAHDVGNLQVRSLTNSRVRGRISAKLGRYSGRDSFADFEFERAISDRSGRHGMRVAIERDGGFEITRHEGRWLWYLDLKHGKNPPVRTWIEPWDHSSITIEYP